LGRDSANGSLSVWPVLFYEGHTALGLYVLCYGRVKLTRLTARGQRLSITSIDLYGLRIEVRAESDALAAEMTRPFKYFFASCPAHAYVVNVVETDPPYEQFPTIQASFSSPRNIVYRNDDQKIIDYFGKGVVVENLRDSEFTLYSRDHNFLIEALYLLVLSLFGQHCDRRGMLRVHALAISYHDKAILITAPQGGGKSTMMFSMLRMDGVKLISDDEPIIGTDGTVMPFPLRLGFLNKESIVDIPSEYVYQIDRMEFGIKYFVDCEYWKDNIETRALTKSVLCTSIRVLNGEPGVTRCSKIRMLRTLMRDAVIGIGLFQGVEFLFSKSSWDILSKIHVAMKRFIRAARLTARSDTYEITLSRDIARNAEVLEDFVKNRLR